MTIWLTRCIALLLLVFPFAGSRLLAQAPANRFAVRCLNKDSVVKVEADGKLNLKLELTATLDKDHQLKPGDFRLAFLDSQLRQLDEIAIAIPEDWQKKTFKKGENKDILTLNVLGGEFKEGREYSLAVILTDRGGEGVFPVWLRLVKFKLGKTAQ